MRRVLFITIALLCCLPSFGQKKHKRDTLEFSDAYLDTVVVNKSKDLNNYSTIGAGYGVCFSNITFNPPKHDRAYVVRPNYFNVMYTHYEKLFDYMAFFSFTGGFSHSYEGVGFKKNEDGSPIGLIDGADRLSIECYEFPIMAQLHFDAEPMMLLASVGVYGGYRTSVQRSGPGIKEDFANSFRDYENRWDYGLQGGVGVAFLMNPFELHINGLIRWGWQSIYQPDYYSPYYYRYAYPTDILISVSLHYQLTKRRGKTNHQIRSEAHDIVYGKN